MFRFKRDFSGLHTDIHSHLIPGIDDGSPDVGTSIELLLGLQKLGYKRVVTTPHIYSALYPNSKKNILEAYFNLRSQIRELNLELQLGIAAEYFIDKHLFDLINRRELLTLPGGYVLIETSPFDQPKNVVDCIFNLRLQDYRPLLAHPERYLFIQKAFDIAFMLREQGCFFQINLLSLLGYYGKKVKETALAFYKNGLVDFWGSDVHHSRHLQALESGLRSRKFYKMISDPKVNNYKLKSNIEPISDKNFSFVK